ncbi:MAG: hypothetical protein LQ349_008041 [Xanthoria aureola]|nr:MAG: hypothetical protein LQ349_008041 [Xanthoria aureola]
MSTSASRVWLITGCSSGFGQEIAKAALAYGERVVATARDPAKLKELESHGATTFALDVLADDGKLTDIIASIIKEAGKIDVLVNNAGYILTGAVEECSRQEALDQFQTNVFGQMNVIRAVLPHMRARRSGVIANLGSIGGWLGVPAAGLYCASKAAITVFTESLRKEVQSLGIEVTTIEPGYFRTNFLSSGHKSRAANVIADYESSIKDNMARLAAYDRKQPGDPAKGAQIIVEALTKTGRCQGRELPPRLALGNDAVSYIAGVIDANRKDLDQWKDLTSTTDCDDV